MGTNPAFARRLLAPLAVAGLIESSHGRDGGVRLALNPGQVTLADVYDAAMGDKPLWTQRADIQHRCVVSTNVEAVYTDLVDEVDNSVRVLLAQKTLASVLEDLHARDRQAGRQSEVG